MVAEMFTASDLDRFWSHVSVQDGPCTRWGGTRNDEGYGVFFVRLNGQARQIRAHRIAYELLVGSIPEDLTLDHTCHTNDLSCVGGVRCLHRLCVTPAHLEPVTRGINTLRGQSLWAENARKTHCPHGHPFDPENTGHWRNQRVCRTCKRDRARERRSIEKAARPPVTALEGY